MTIVARCRTFLHNRRRSPGIIVNSLPKSGTNLARKLIGLFPGTRDTGMSLHAKWVLCGPGECPPDHSHVMVGIGHPARLATDVFVRLLDRLQAGCHTAAHLPFSEGASRLISERGLRMLLVRDPRDVALSHSEYVAAADGHVLNHYYRDLDPEQRLTASIEGTNADGSLAHPLIDVGARCRAVLGWRECEHVLLVRFEDLVGAGGGGSDATQLQTVRAIAEHCRLRCDDPAALAERLYGGTRTFNQGKIGRWRKCFTNEHVDTFKRLAGDVLIEMGYESDLNWDR